MSLVIAEVHVDGLAQAEPARVVAPAAEVAGPPLQLRLAAIVYAARDVNLYRFESLDGQPLPPYEPGAHVDLHLPNGLVRPYSLALPYRPDAGYVVGVKRDAASRGGSHYMHDALRVGTVLSVGRPRNHFALADDAAHSILIAGGIGITPIYCMARHLVEAGHRCEIHYAVKRREDAAFVAELRALGVSFHLYVSEDASTGRVDLAGLLRDPSPGSHFYCCGPEAMHTAFVAAAAALPAAHIHFEHFAGVTPAGAEQAFTVRLAKSGREIQVQPGKSIARTLIDHGVDVELSCEQGVCGVCETRVLGGCVEHRDLILSDAEKQSNKTIMLCCSTSRDPLLILDL